MAQNLTGRYKYSDFRARAEMVRLFDRINHSLPFVLIPAGTSDHQHSSGAFTHLHVLFVLRMRFNYFAALHPVYITRDGALLVSLRADAAGVAVPFPAVRAGPECRNHLKHLAPTISTTRWTVKPHEWPSNGRFLSTKSTDHIFRTETRAVAEVGGAYYEYRTSDIAIHLVTILLETYVSYYNRSIGHYPVIMRLYFGRGFRCFDGLSGESYHLHTVPVLSRLRRYSTHLGGRDG